MIQVLIYASLAATLIIIIAMHHMKEGSFVVWLNGLFLFWCGIAPIGALTYNLLAKGF